MSKTDPLKPAHIPGQNPNTPERLQGEMRTDADHPGNHRVFLFALLGIPAALAVALTLIYATMSADPAAKPNADPPQATQDR